MSAKKAKPVSLESGPDPRGTGTGSEVEVGLNWPSSTSAGILVVYVLSWMIGSWPMQSAMNLITTDQTMKTLRANKTYTS